MLCLHFTCVERLKIKQCHKSRYTLFIYVPYCGKYTAYTHLSHRKLMDSGAALPLLNSLGFFLAFSHHRWLAGPPSPIRPPCASSPPPCAALTSWPGEGLLRRAAGAVCGAEPTPLLRLRPPASVPLFSPQLHASASPGLISAAGGRLGLH